MNHQIDRISRIKLSAGSVFWREAGSRDNPVIICLHGSWHDGSQWAEIVKPLSQNFHCFTLDLLGYGNSKPISTVNSIAIEVDCLAEFITALKLNSVYLVGHSLGAWIGISHTLKSPDLIRGVIAISPEGYSLNNWNKYGKFTKYILAHPWLLRLWMMGLRALSSLSDGAIWVEKTQSHWQFFQKFPTTCQILFSRSRRAVSSELVADKLGQFRLPLYILQDDRDSPGTIEQSKAYARAVRHAEYQSISTQSAQRIAEEISNFIIGIEAQIDREELDLW